MARRSFTVSCSTTDGVRGPRSAVVQVLRRASRVLPRFPRVLSLTVVLCGRRRIQRLNRLYRHVDRPTDVLSFAYGDAHIPVSPDGGLTGEIYLCVPIAREQAAQYGHSLRHEVELLAVHGLLHILGYDHATRRDAATMRTHENRILGRRIARSASTADR